MSANLLLHVREHPEGRVIVTPVDFPDLTVDADTYEAALRAVTGKLTRKLRSLTGSMRTALAAPVVAELDRVELSIQRPKTTVTVSIGLVVSIQETSAGLLYVVRAPEVPELAIPVKLRDAVHSAARAALRERLSHWNLEALLASDEVGEVRLETLTLPFPPVEDPQLTRGDDQFVLEEFGDELTVRAAEGRLGSSTGATPSWSACSRPWPRRRARA